MSGLVELANKKIERAKNWDVPDKARVIAETLGDQLNYFLCGPSTSLGRALDVTKKGHVYQDSSFIIETYQDQNGLKCVDIGVFGKVFGLWNRRENIYSEKRDESGEVKILVCVRENDFLPKIEDLYQRAVSKGN